MYCPYEAWADGKKKMRSYGLCALKKMVERGWYNVHSYLMEVAKVT